MEKFEKICTVCSKPFETTDVNTEYCPECWAAFIEKELDGEGMGE